MNFLRLLDKVFPPKIAYAHCDIPCGIYKKDAMITAAETVVKMVEKIAELPHDNPTVENRNFFVRAVVTREQHAELCKREALILWTDFFKEEHLAKWPDLHTKVWEITKLCSHVKREVNLDRAKELLALVKELGDILEEAQKTAR